MWGSLLIRILSRYIYSCLVWSSNPRWSFIPWPHWHVLSLIILACYLGLSCPTRDSLIYFVDDYFQLWYPCRAYNQKLKGGIAEIHVKNVYRRWDQFSSRIYQSFWIGWKRTFVEINILWPKVLWSSMDGLLSERLLALQRQRICGFLLLNYLQKSRCVAQYRNCCHYGLLAFGQYPGFIYAR
jgi:hypothetical protein